MSDYEVIGIDESEYPLIHFSLYADCDPITYEGAIQHSKWRKATDNETAAIKKNDTWELTELQKGMKIKDHYVKWIYKTKFKENGEIGKHKATHLVVKGYKQEFGMDYKEVFTLVTRYDTIRLTIALTAQDSWSIFQLDVK